MALSPSEIDAHLKQWRPLVKALANSFLSKLRPAHELDDIVAIGMEALWNAAKTFDATRGAKFYTYARRVVLYRYLLEVKNLNTANRRVIYHCKQSVDATDESGSQLFTPVDTERRDPEAELVLQRRVQALNAARARLPVRQNRVIHDRYMRDRTLEEIGGSLGITREGARQIEVAAIDKLRAWMPA